MTATSPTAIPGPASRGVITWPSPAERDEALVAGMADYTLARMDLAPAREATFHASFALRWGADPRQVARALARVVERGAR